MKRYFGQAVLALSMSSHLLFGAGTSALMSGERDLSISDSAAAEIMSKASVGWRLKANVTDSIFRKLYEGEVRSAEAENKAIQTWLAGDRSGEHPLTPKNDGIDFEALSTVIGFPLEHLMTANQPPETERSRVKKFAAKVLAWGLNAFPLDTESSPLIPSDNNTLLSLCFPAEHRELLAAPHMPKALLECEGDVIGACTTAGPFSSYVSKANSDEINQIPPDLMANIKSLTRSPVIYKAGLPEYSAYTVKEGLEQLGGEAYLVQLNGKMKTVAIRYKNEWFGSDSAGWDHAQKIVMATLGTDITVVQHLINTHLITAGTFSTATCRLGPTHPIREFLLPHTLGTLGINNYNVPILLRKGAMFDSLYSYSPEELLRLMNNKVFNFNIDEMDPTLDSERRQVQDLIGFGNLPFGHNEDEIWNVIRSHVSAYIDECYMFDSQLTDDAEMVTWYKDIKRYIPNQQIEVYAPILNKDSLARLMTLFIYTASVKHDLVGVMVYNYLPWMNHIPTKVKADGSSPSLGVAKLAANLLLVVYPTSLSTVVDNSYSELINPKRRDPAIQLRLSLAKYQRNLETLDEDVLASISQPKKQIPSVHS